MIQGDFRWHGQYREILTAEDTGRLFTEHGIERLLRARDIGGLSTAQAVQGVIFCITDYRKTFDRTQHRKAFDSTGSMGKFWKHKIQEDS